MVRRFLNLLARETVNFQEAAVLLGAAAVVSQLLSLARDRLLAARFGAGHVLDVYYAAFRLPDMLYVGIASFVSITVLIPFLVTRLEEEKNLRSSREFLSQAFSFFIVVMVICAALAFWLLPELAPWLAPGLPTTARADFVSLSRLLLLSPLLLGLSNLFGGVVQAHRLFFLYAWSPIVYNLGIIVGVLFFAPHWGTFGLGLGVVLGAAAHWLILAPAVWRRGLWPLFSFRCRWATLAPVLRLSLPRTIALSSHNLSLLVLVALATLLGEGAVAVFNFAFNLQSVPLAVVGVSYSVAAFPTLIRLARGARDGFLTQMTSAVRSILFWSLPAAALFVVLRAQIVRTILGYGLFDWRDTRLTAAALALFALSVPAQSLALLFIRAYYSAGATRRPVIISLAAAASQVALAIVGLWWWSADPIRAGTISTWLRVGDLGETAIIFLPFAFSLGVLIQLGGLWFFFRRDFGRLPIPPRFVGDLSLATSTAALTAYFVLRLADNWFDLERVAGVFGQGLVAGLFGLLVFVAVLRARGNEDLRSLGTALRRRFWRVRVAAESPTEIL